MKEEEQKASKVPETQKEMTIKELAGKANLTLRAPRYCEEIGILNGIKRDPYNRRRYTKKELYRLKLVQRVRDIGLEP